MVIHIAQIGVEIAHVFEGIKDKQFGQPDKLYLLHSPNQKKQLGKKQPDSKTQFQKIASDVKNQLEGFVETHLVEINAFDMNSVWDAINKIIKEEFENDESLILKDFAIKGTCGTNLMAVAATIASGTRGVRAYYVLNKKFKENKKPYVRELTIPNFKRERGITRNLHQLLRVISEQKFRWPGVNLNTRKIETEAGLPISVGVIVKDGIKPNWINKRTEFGWVSRTNLLDIMKNKYKIPKQTITNRLVTLQERGLILIQKNVPKLKPPSRSASKYSKYEYKIDNKELLISITSNGISELRYQKND